MIRDEILEKIQAEGLAIIKLHEKLNSYIIAVNEKTDESIKKIFDDLNNLCDTNPFGDSRFGG